MQKLFLLRVRVFPAEQLLVFVPRNLIKNKDISASPFMISVISKANFEPVLKYVRAKHNK